MKVRIKFRKFGVMKFISHLDVMRYFQKAMRRAEIPISFTAGMSPHMIMSFAQPLGVGLTSDAEYLDVEIREAVPSALAVRRLNEVMADGMEIVSFLQIPEDKKSSGMTVTAAADYLAFPVKGEIPPAWMQRAEEFIAQDQIVVRKKTKRSEKDVDILPMIYQFVPKEQAFFLKLAAGSEQNLKPELVMDAFQDFAGTSRDTFSLRYHRAEIYAKAEGDSGPEFCSLESFGREIPFGS